MKCLTPEMLERYINDKVTGSELPSIEQHLKQCPNCSKQVAEALENESMLSVIRSLSIDSKISSDHNTPPATEPLGIEKAQELLGKRYRVTKKVGSGGAGEVFQAVDAILERAVAIKFLRQKPSNDKKNAWNEARMMGQFNHPNIAHVHEIGLSQGWRFIVMEWVEGSALTEIWSTMPLEKRLKLFLDVVIPVGAAHRQGIFRRDLKPSNNLVNAAREVKILDFGIALDVDTSDTQERRVYRGTPAYSAPEQISAPQKIGPPTDVFALGILLYQLLTDTLPFTQTKTRALFKEILIKYPELPNAIRENVPLPLQNICLKALEKDPTKRYPDAQALAEDINRYLRGEIVWSRPSFLTDKIQQEVYFHRQKLKSWYDNDLITQSEFDRLENIYDRIISPTDPSIIEARKLSLSQVLLYLGGWIAILGSAVLFYDAWEQISRQWRPMPAIGATVLLTLFGSLLWCRRESRLSVGFLATANLLAPLAILLSLGHWQIMSPLNYPWGQETLIKIHATLSLGNTQMAISACAWLLCSLLFLRVTRSSVFVLYAVIAFFAILTVAFLIHGLRDWPVEIIAGRYLYPAFGLFVGGMILDRRGIAHYAWPLCVVGLAVLIASLSFIASSPVTLFGWIGYPLPILGKEEQLYLSFVANGLVYLILAGLCRQAQTRLQRRIALVLNWLGPLHILAPLRILDKQEIDHRLIYRALLPIASMCFVLGSVVRQMQSFFFSGLAVLAVAVHTVPNEHFRKIFTWPIALIIAGILCMFISWIVPLIKARWTLRRKN